MCESASLQGQLLGSGFCFGYTAGSFTLGSEPGDATDTVRTIASTTSSGLITPPHR
jgi:hypothetical protein